MSYIRILNGKDSEQFQIIRLFGLQESPDAFMTAAEEFEQQPAEMLAGRMVSRGNPPEQFILGAFNDSDQLVGLVGMMRHQHRKALHSATIWGFYVAPSARGEGLGKALLQHVIAYAQEVPGLEKLLLTVSINQTVARNLYRSLGFRVYGLEKHAAKDGDRYIDEELLSLDLVKHIP